jgi:hypothetical protein
MDKQENFTPPDLVISNALYFPAPLRRWFIQLAKRTQINEERVSGTEQKKESDPINKT